jgi:hypothetical protein
MHVNLSSISPISNRATQQQSNNKSDKKQETGPAVTGCKKGVVIVRTRTNGQQME